MHVDPKREVLRSNTGRIGLVLFGLIVLMAIFAPLLATHDPIEQTVHSFEAPSWNHLLGTNHVGQDVWSQLVYGARTSLIVGLSVASGIHRSTRGSSRPPYETAFSRLSVATTASSRSRSPSSQSGRRKREANQNRAGCGLRPAVSTGDAAPCRQPTGRTKKSTAHSSVCGRDWIGRARAVGAVGLRTAAPSPSRF